MASIDSRKRAQKTVNIEFLDSVLCIGFRTAWKSQIVLMKKIFHKIQIQFLPYQQASMSQLSMIFLFSAVERKYIPFLALALESVLTKIAKTYH